MNQEIPQQLKSYVRSIAIRDVDYEKVCRIRLMAAGFKQAEELAPKVTSVIESGIQFISRTTKEISHIQMISNIISAGSMAITHLHNEELSLAFAAFNIFSPFIDHSSFDVLFGIIFASFPIGSSYKDLGEMMKQMLAQNIVLQQVEKEIKLIGTDVPVDYLLAQTSNALSTIFFNTISIICGPTNSGKTLILDLIKRAFDREEIQKQNPLFKSVVIADIYHESESPSSMFGKAVDDPSTGYSLLAGQADAVLYSLTSLPGTCRKILRFDGRITPELVNYLSRTSRKIAQMDVRIVIETDSMEGATPSLLSRSGLILMKNAQESILQTSVCSLDHPLLPFSRAVTALASTINTTNLDKFKSLFCNVMPAFIKKLFSMENLLCSSASKYSVPGGHLIISDILPMYVSMLALYTFQMQSKDMDSEENLCNVFGWSFLKIASGVLDQSLMKELDTFVRTGLNIGVPVDWNEFNLTPDFIEEFPQPNLLSLTPFNSKLLPIQLPSQRAIYTPGPEASLPISISHVTIIPNSWVNDINLASNFLKMGQHLIIHGPPHCGKSSFVRAVLHLTDESRRTIYISATPVLTGETLTSYIKRHTSLMSLTVAPDMANIIFYLIFDNVSPKDKILLGFISQILKMKKVPIYSKNDPKIYDLISLRNFRIIITTNQYYSLNTRFLSQFVPIHLAPLKESSAKFISNQLMTMYGMDKSTTTFAIDFFSKCFHKLPEVEFSHGLIMASQTMCSLADKHNSKQVMMALYSSIFGIASHIYPVKDLTELILDIVSGYPHQEISQTASIFLDRGIIINPKFNLAPDLTSFTVSYSAEKVDKLIKELQYMVSVFNTSSPFKLSARINYYNLRAWIGLSTTFNTPGHHAIMLGPPGSGRLTLTQLAANTDEFDFVNIMPPTPEEALSPHERLESIQSIIRDIVTNTIMNHKKTIIFMRVTKDNHQEKSLIKAFVSQFDFVPFFEEQALDELYQSFSSITNPTPEQRRVTMKKIQLQLSTSVHLVLSVEDADLHTIKNTFDIIKPFDQPITIMLDIINLFITDPDLPSDVKDNIQAFTNVIIQMIKESKEIHPKFNRNMLFDFLSALKECIVRDKANLELKRDSLDGAINFINEIKQDNVTITAKMKDIAPKIQRLRIDTDSLEQSYNTRKEAIEARRVKLQEDKKYKEEKLNQSTYKLEQLERDHSLLQPAYEKATQAVLQMVPADIETIRITLVGPPHKSITTVFEALGFLLDLPKPYYDNALQLMNQPDFSDKITSITISKLTPKMLEKAKEILDESNVNPGELENICLPMRPIFDYLDSVTKLAELEETLKGLKKSHEEESRQLTEFLEEMNLEIQSINQVEESLVKEKQEVEESNQARERMEEEYKDITERKERIDRVSQNIDILLQSWEEARKSYENQANQVLGDAISLTYYIVFCGSLPKDQRISLMNQVSSILEQKNIPVSYTEPMEFINDRFILDSTGDDLIHYENCPSQSVMIDVQHLFSSTRTPLLIDPDGIITNFIIESIKQKRIITISATSSTLETSIQTAVSDGKILVLLDVDSLQPAIEQAMLIPLTDEKTSSRDIKIGSKVVQWDPKFKMILVSSVSANLLPEEITSRVIIIDVSSSSAETTEAMFTNMFIDFFSPTLTPRIAEMRKKELGKRVLVQKYENDILDTLSDIIATRKMDPKYDYLADEDVISDIITSKESYFEYISGTTDFTDLKAEIKEAIKPFQQHIDLCQIFWTALSRYVAVVNPAARISFNSYLKYISQIFVNEGLHAGALSSDQHAVLHSTLMTSTFQFIFPSLKISEMYFFMFICGYLLGKDTGKIQEDDFIAVMEHIEDERLDVCDFENCDPNDGGSFEGLKFTNILNIFNYIRHFIRAQFGEGFVPVFPHFQVENIVSNTGSIPTVIVAPYGVDPSGMVISFISQRCKHENFDEVSLSDDPEMIKYTRKLVTTSMNRGNWVLLHYSKPNRAAAQLITDLFTLMSTSSINTNFRLIVICTTLEFIASSILLRAKRFTIDDSGSLRNTMLQLFGHHNAQIMSTSNPQAVKRVSYLALLAASLVNFRNNMQPLTFSTKIKPQELAIRDSLKELHMLADSYINGMPPVIVASHLQSILFTNVSESNDYETLNTVLNRIFNSHMFDENYSLAEGEEKERWQMPGDIPLSGFTQVIQKLPLFPSAAVYGMNSAAGKHMINWTLSQIITKPFTEFVKKHDKVKPEAVLQKIDNLEMLIPESVQYPSALAWTMRTLFLVREINKLNTALTIISSSLRDSRILAQKDIVDDIGYYIARGKAPPLWKKVANYYVTNQVNKFASHIIERHALLTAWAQGVVPSSIDVSLLDDINGLLLSFLCEVALSHGVSQTQLIYEFSLGASSSSNDEIVLTKVVASYLSIQDGKVSFIPETQQKPLSQIPELVCKVIDKDAKPLGKFAKIPFYKFASSDFFEHANFPISSGKSDNFVCYVELPTEIKESFLGTGAALFCRTPLQFL